MTSGRRPSATLSPSTLCYSCLLTFSFITVVKRDNDGSGRLSAYVNTSIDYVRGIPLFGGYVADFLDWLVRAISLFEAGTNGALARLLGGVLPCRITLDGTDCAGLSNNGGFEKLFMDVLDGIPSLILPDIGPISRLADAIFGGVSIN